MARLCTNPLVKQWMKWIQMVIARLWPWQTRHSAQEFPTQLEPTSGSFPLSSTLHSLPGPGGSRVIFTCLFFFSLPSLLHLVWILGECLASFQRHGGVCPQSSPNLSAQTKPNTNEHDKSCFSTGVNPHFSWFPRKSPESLCVKDKPKVDTGSL